MVLIRGGFTELFFREPKFDMGVDRGVYPLPWTFTLGVNVNF